MNQTEKYEIRFEECPGGMRMLPCSGQDEYGYGEVVEVPELKNGRPVVELASYALAKSPVLQEVYLPQTLKKIGRYGFYNSENLHTIHCYSTTVDLGAGVFAGCKRLQNIEIAVVKGQKSCLKELLSEIQGTLRVRYQLIELNQKAFWEQDEASLENYAELIFPQFYEEAIENTPARILETHTHGCGHRYRYCFQGTELQFKAYDDVFHYLCIEESEEMAAELAVKRLRFPCGLQEISRQQYYNYVQNHTETAFSWMLRQQDAGWLSWMAEQFMNTEEAAEQMTSLAGRWKLTEAVSYLMDLQHRKFKLKRKSFRL